MTENMKVNPDKPEQLSDTINQVTSSTAQQNQVVSADYLPGWVQWWQQEPTFSYDLEVLRTLAQTGLPRVADVAGALQTQHRKEYSLRNVNGIIGRYKELGMVEVIEAKSATRGGAKHRLIRLTERGQRASQLVWGLQPVPSHTTLLLTRHKNPTQTLLVLEAADLLREASYAVNMLPPRIKLPGDPYDHIFAPNLIATWNEQVFFIEVKRDTHRGPEPRHRKWQNYHNATGGGFHIITPDERALDALKEEILTWAHVYAHVRQFRLWMTSINEVRGTDRHGDDFWMHKYQEPHQTYR